MEKVLEQFKNNMLSKEHMNAVKGGKGQYCIRFDTIDGCGAIAVNVTATKQETIDYGDRVVGTSGCTGYNISNGPC